VMLALSKIEGISCSVGDYIKGIYKAG